MISLSSILHDVSASIASPAETLAQAREAILSRDSVLKSFAHVAPGEQWLAGNGPLSGVAVGLKDIIDTADLPTEMGCPEVWGGWRPRADAALVGLLLRAGATIAGKTATTALAHLDPAPTLNPHDPARTPGGSSSGSAAAVAAGLVPLAIGTQTGGSVIRPAAFCGVAAVKPSFRLIPTAGVKAAAWTLDTVGLFAATVADCAVALGAITGRDMRPPEDPGRPSVGIVLQEFAGPADPAAVMALERARRAMVDAGWTVTTVTLPEAVADGWSAQALVQDHEMRIACDWEWRLHREALPPKVREALRRGGEVDVAAYDGARARARRARTGIRSVFIDHGLDALLTYSAPGPAPARDSTGDARFNRLWTLLGVPCVNVPGIRTSTGLPLGLQVIAPFARDRQALAVAKLLEPLLQELPLIDE